MSDPQSIIVVEDGEELASLFKAF